MAQTMDPDRPGFNLGSVTCLLLKSRRDHLPSLEIVIQLFHKVMGRI